jgi:hypothetical protein
MIAKPRNMMVEAFINHLKVMVHYVNNIRFPRPDAPLINTTKVKNIIFRAMPVIWQTDFLRVNHVSPTMVLQLQQFMSQEREFAKPQNMHSNSSQ